MSLEHTSGAMMPDLHAHHDYPGQKARSGRRMRALDFCAGAFLAASALAVIANVMVFQPSKPALRAMAAQALSGGTAAPQNGFESGTSATSGDATAPAFTSIPLPRAAPDRTGRTTAAAGDGNLGYLASNTSVSSMDSALVPVRPNETNVQGLTTPKRLSTQRPPANVGAPTASADVVRPPQGLPVSSRTLSVQRALAKLGYGPLKVDGVDSAQTRQAIQRFQKDRNLTADGLIGPVLLRELSAVSGMKVQ